MKFRPSILPKGVRLVGNVAGDEDLVVFGTVEGEIDVGGTVIVEESGVVKGNVHGRSVSVRGIVIGDASADETIRVDEGGSMVGDVHAPRVNIVKGAKFRGHVHMTGTDAERDLRSVTRRERTRAARPSASERPPRVAAAAIEPSRVERTIEPAIERPAEMPVERRAETPVERRAEAPVERRPEARAAAPVRVEPAQETDASPRPRRHRRRFAIEPKTTPGTIPADRSDTLAGSVFAPAEPEIKRPARSGPPLPVFPTVGRVRAVRRDPEPTGPEKAVDH